MSGTHHFWSSTFLIDSYSFEDCCFRCLWCLCLCVCVCKQIWWWPLVCTEHKEMHWSVHIFVRSWLPLGTNFCLSFLTHLGFCLNQLHKNHVFYFFFSWLVIAIGKKYTSQSFIIAYYYLMVSDRSMTFPVLWHWWRRVQKASVATFSPIEKYSDRQWHWSGSTCRGMHCHRALGSTLLLFFFSSNSPRQFTVKWNHLSPSSCHLALASAMALLHSSIGGSPV